MPYVKLDTGILNSTLWVNRDERDIFITALLMAEPFEVKEPKPQLAVDKIEETGFTVPPGWYGLIPAAGPGIVRRALVDPPAGMEALRRLGDPDHESRSQDFEGRRLVRVNGGYIALNYMAYRDKDHRAADRMRALRARKKSNDVTANTENVTANTENASTDVTRTLRIADADADADVKRKKSNVGLTPDQTPPVSVNAQLRQQAIDVLYFLNEKTGRAYEPVPANIQPIIARMKQGSSVDDIRAVIAKKCREWSKDEKMVQYLRPKTLFSATNFANYKGELIHVDLPREGV